MPVPAQLVNASEFVFAPHPGVVHVSDETKAYRRVVRDRIVSGEEVERALEVATPAGRAFVGAVICSLHPKQAEPLLEDMLADEAGVIFRTAPGCSIVPTSVRACARWMLSGCPPPAPKVDTVGFDVDVASFIERDGEAMRRAIVEALRRTDGSCATAARLLGISRRTFWRRCNELGIVY